MPAGRGRAPLPRLVDGHDAQPETDSVRAEGTRLPELGARPVEEAHEVPEELRVGRRDALELGWGQDAHLGLRGRRGAAQGCPEGVALGQPIENGVLAADESIPCTMRSVLGVIPLARKLAHPQSDVLSGDASQRLVSEPHGDVVAEVPQVVGLGALRGPRASRNGSGACYRRRR